jgi:hypothetical protein
MAYPSRATDTVRRVLIKASAITAAVLAAPLLLSAVAHAEPAPEPVPQPAPVVAPAPETPPAPDAAPVVDPAAICAQPEYGGVLVTDPPAPDGVTRSNCQYIVSGRFYYDNYENGVYVGTLMFWDGQKVPTARPQMPELLNIPGNMPTPVIPFPGQF